MCFSARSFLSFVVSLFSCVLHNSTPKTTHSHNPFLFAHTHSHSSHVSCFPFTFSPHSLTHSLTQLVDTQPFLSFATVMTSAILSTKRNRGSNWEAEFYKNGYPKEIIVIEDTPPPDQATTTTTTTTNKSHANASYTVVPAPAPPTPSAFNNTTMAPRSSSKRQRPAHNNNESTMSTSTIPNNNHFLATNKRRRRHYPQPVPTLNALNNVGK